VIVFDSVDPDRPESEFFKQHFDCILRPYSTGVTGVGWGVQPDLRREGNSCTKDGRALRNGLWGRPVTTKPNAGILER
jgi:hypothetical protein